MIQVFNAKATERRNDPETNYNLYGGRVDPNGCEVWTNFSTCKTRDEAWSKIPLHPGYPAYFVIHGQWPLETPE